MTEERIAQIRAWLNLGDAPPGMDPDSDYINDEIVDELLTEVVRLRAALQRIADHEWSFASWEGNCSCPRAAEHLLAGRNPADDPYC